MIFLKKLFSKLKFKIGKNSQSKYLQESIINDLPNYYIFWKDLNSVYLGCNKAFATLANVGSPENIVGKNDYDLPWTKEYSDKFRSDDKEVMESGKPKLNIEEPHKLKNGEIVVLLTSKIPLINNNKVFGVFGICCNVTDQKVEETAVRETNIKLEHAYQEAQQLQSSIINYLPNYFIFWKDINGKYLGCNTAFARLAGQNSPSDLIGKCDYDYWSKEESDAYVADDKEVMRIGKPKLDIEEPQTTAQGEKIILSTSKVPLIDEKGKVYGLVGICSNITHQKEAEQNLLKTNKKLEEAYKAKSEFIRNVSHDIRTPLSGIMQSSRFIYERGIEEEEIPEYAYHIWQAAIKLMSLFNQVIEVTKTEAYEFEDQTSKFDLYKLLDNLRKTYTIVAKHKGIELKLEYSNEVPRYLLGKPLRLHRILMNLLGNAFKFTQKGSIILYIEDAQNSTDDQIILRFTVTDTGIGIPKEKHTVIFEPFERLQYSYQGLYPGSGLGLSLVKSYIEKMQGEIYVESEIDKGSKFTCLIPFKRPILNNDKDILDIEYEIEQQILHKDIPLFTTSTKISDTKEQKTKNILLVEDDELARKMGSRILSNIPLYQVDSATSGEQALEMTNQKLYQLIYMDVGLPGIDGIETVKQIRTNPLNINHKTYIVALTAHADEEIIQQCLDVGMQEVLQKPLTPEKAYKLNNALPLEKKEEIVNDNNLLDWPLWFSRVGNDKETAYMTFHIFATDLESYQKNITASIKEKDLTKLQAITHKMKGALGYCGLPRLENIIKKVESSAKEQDFDKILEEYSELLETLEKTKQIYQEWSKMYPKTE